MNEKLEQDLTDYMIVASHVDGRRTEINLMRRLRKEIENLEMKLASDGDLADVRCRFDSGDQVRVKFRKLDRFWNGMVHKDDGGRYVEVIKNGLHWEITKVERDRIKIAS